MIQNKATPIVAERVLALDRTGVSPANIAMQVGLSRMEVLAILGHARLNAAEPVAFDEPATLPELPVPYTPSEVFVPPAPLQPGSEVVDGAIYIGDDSYDEAAYWHPSSPDLVPNPHLMIMGESGSGKTYATQGIVAELALAGIPTIIFDYGQSFELETLDAQFRGYCEPKEHLVGEEGLALNPLQIFERDTHGPASVATRLSDVFDAAYKLGDIQRKVVIDAVVRVFEDVGITRTDPTTWSQTPPTIEQLQLVIDSMAADRHYASSKNALSLSARLTTFFMLAQFRATGSWSWSDLLQSDQKVQILQFRGLEGKTQRVLVEMLLWHLFFHLKNQGQNALRVFCVLDEAHHLSFRESGPVNALLREARKFGVGLIFASQQPEDFSPVAYSNSASKLIFQTADPALRISRFLAPKLSNFDSPEEVRDAIAALQRGKALFISRNRGHVVNVASFPKRTTLWGPRT
ncbi:MAG TPA: DUF87 domain-containing protein [Thermoanaerobaculia bacterium]|nr:DUF87 domain-containing protein [Thermoanaerobaculia bacterium]